MIPVGWPAAPVDFILSRHPPSDKPLSGIFHRHAGRLACVHLFQFRQFLNPRPLHSVLAFQFFKLCINFRAFPLRCGVI